MAADAKVRFVRFGPFELDVRAGELRKHGIKIKLREQPVRILLMLLERPGEVVLREDIRQRLWPNNTIVEFDHGINAAIQKLREALGESAGLPRYVETVARRGYRFLGEVERAGELHPEADDPAPVDDGDLSGKTISHFRILEKLGEGGMGVVYRAEDLTLGRQVALKFLQFPVDELLDSTRQRFEREARAVAALNHPNICALYDVGPNYLVMELIEGLTLAEWMAKAPIPQKEALAIARQIAEALEAAHEKGIVHRDLKPANIKLTAEGQVKVLDFGLAKVQEPAAADSEETPTLTVSATQAGVILGTAAYMSPEQAAGLPVDRRADIWSFGVVLWESLTGQRLFEGETLTQTLAEVLRKPIVFDQLPGETPASIRVLVRRCLDRNAKNRLQAIGEARIAIEAVLAGETSASSDAHTVTVLVRRHRGLAAAVVVVVALAAGFFVGTLWHSPPQRPSSASPIEDLQITQLTSTGSAERPAISPDGRHVAYIQHEGNAYSLWMRQVDTANQAQIVPAEPGTTILGATVTPDGAFVEFVLASTTAVRQELWRVPFLGGTPKKLLDNFVSAAGWSPDGKHYAFLRKLDPIKPDPSMALIIADANGSHERQVTVRQSNGIDGLFNQAATGHGIHPASRAQFDRSWTRPAWSPDGRVVAVLGSDSPGEGPTEPVVAQVVAVDVATGAERVLPVRLTFSLGFGPAWLDPETIVLTGAVEDGAPNQLWRLSYPGGQLSRLSNDLSNYIGVNLTADRSSLVTGRSDVLESVWVGNGSGANGTDLVPLTPAPRQLFAGVAWAGERLLHVKTANGHPSIAATTGTAGSDEIVTNGLYPNVSPDGRTIVFQSAETGDHSGLWKVDADGRHAVQLVSGNAKWPVVTPDGQRVIFCSDRLQSLWSVSIDGGTPMQLANVFAYFPDVSPDGKLLVFGASNTRGELGICDLPACTNLRKFTTPPGGPRSRWTPDGKGIAFYDDGRGGNLWVQPLDGSAPKKLTHFADDRRISGFAWSRDGKRLAISRSTETNDIVLFKGLRR